MFLINISAFASHHLIVQSINVKNVFYVFIIFTKTRFNVFYFLVGNFFYSTKPPKLLHKTTINW